MISKMVVLALAGFALVPFLGSGVASADEMGTSRSRFVDNVDKNGDIGVGVQAGSFSGLNMEDWLTNNRAITAALAFQSSNTALSLDHRWFARHQFSGAARDLAPYVGAGAIGIFGNNNDNYDRSTESFVLAAQAPLGIEYLPEAQRFSAFAELVPAIEVTPVAAGVMSADIGARIYF